MGLLSKSTVTLAQGCLSQPTKPAWAYELEQLGLRVQRQKAVPLIYRDVRLDCGFRADMVVENHVVLELKCKEALHPVDQAPLLSHLRLLKMPIGLLINFHVVLLKDGIRRMVNDYRDSNDDRDSPGDRRVAVFRSS